MSTPGTCAGIARTLLATIWALSYSFLTMKTGSLLKLILSALMLVIVFYLVDIDELIVTFRSIPISLAVFVILGFALSQAISAYKWWLMIRIAGLNISLTDSIKAYFIGMFINCFGFGVVGGDVARGLIVSRGKPIKTVALSTVVADRVHGLAVLALLGALAAILLGGRVEIESGLLYLLVIIGMSIAIGWFIGPRLSLFLLAKFKPDNQKLQQKLKDLWKTFPSGFYPLLIISVVSAVVHVLQIALHYIMGVGLGAEISWAYLFVTIPFVAILTSLPISWNGLGVRENAYIFFLSPMVLSPEQAVAFGALWLLAMTLSAACGGMIALITKDLSSLSKNANLAAQPASQQLKTT